MGPPPLERIAMSSSRTSDKVALAFSRARFGCVLPPKGGENRAGRLPMQSGPPRTPALHCVHGPVSSNAIAGVWLVFAALGLVLSAVFSTLASESCSNATTVILVVGAPGEPEYGSNFLQQASLWEKAAAQAGDRCITIGRCPDAQTNDLALLQQTLAAQP